MLSGVRCRSDCTECTLCPKLYLPEPAAPRDASVHVRLSHNHSTPDVWSGWRNKGRYIQFPSCPLISFHIRLLFDLSLLLLLWYQQLLHFVITCCCVISSHGLCSCLPCPLNTIRLHLPLSPPTMACPMSGAGFDAAYANQRQSKLRVQRESEVQMNNNNIQLCPVQHSPTSPFGDHNEKVSLDTQQVRCPFLLPSFPSLSSSHSFLPSLLHIHPMTIN